jgi:anti-sigma factor RsiW
MLALSSDLPKKAFTVDELKHLEEELLEVYLLGRLPAQQAGKANDPELCGIEEHLLMCPSCVARAEQLDETAAALKAALLALHAERTSRTREPKVMTASHSLRC